MVERDILVDKSLIKCVFYINKVASTFKTDAEFCRTIGMKPPFLVSIRRGDKLISPAYVLKLKELYNISPTDLRPDIYPEWLFNKQA